MVPKRDELQQKMSRFKDVLRRRGVKVTHQRMEIYCEVARTGDHPDAESVYNAVRKRIPTVSLDTVYRTLWLLMDLRLVSTLGSPRERVRFDANMSRHHHFICTRCGAARDFYSEQLDTLPIPDAVKALGSVETTHVEVRGLCSRCSKRKRQ